jgi:hypothetical protein
MGKKGIRIGLAVTAVAALSVWMSPTSSADNDPCTDPVNEIVEENCLPGTSYETWDLTGPSSAGLQGYSAPFSVAQGGTIQFKVDSAANAAYRIDIYRLGYYGSDGARLWHQIPQHGGTDQGNCPPGTDGLVRCNWSTTDSWAVPANAVSGVYIAHLIGANGENHIPFVVRDDDGRSDLLFQTSDTTWQAYNAYGENSLYTGGPGDDPSRAYKVSYDRPFITRDDLEEDFLFNAEYPMIRWLERSGYDVSYFGGADSDQRAAELVEHRAFLSVGHDEYWSGRQRRNVEAARDAGVDLAFFSGNEVFWKTRWEDGHRTLVSYKDTHANSNIGDASWTGTFRDKRPINPEGPDPENALTGQLFTVNSGTRTIEVPAADGKMRIWRDTAAATLGAGGSLQLGTNTLGYEWDEDVDNGARPPGLVRLSTTDADNVEKLQDEGSTYLRDSATHHLTLYRDTNGTGDDALVFGAGTVQWAWGLDNYHDRPSGSLDRTMQQATANLFADMGVQPATLQTDLIPPSPSTDRTGPEASLNGPATVAVAAGVPETIGGTAADAGGGRVGAVEVSTDGGGSWHPANGRETWSYTWTPGSSGTVTPLVRAADDSGNLGPGTQPPDTGPPPGGDPPGGDPPGGDPPGGNPPGGNPPGANPPGGNPPGGDTTPPGGDDTPRGPGGDTPAGPVRLRVGPARVRVSRAGTVRLRLTCPAGDRACRTRVALRRSGITIATGRATIPAGKSRALVLRLERGMGEIRRRGSLKVKAVATTAGRDDVDAVRTSLKLLRPGRN